MTVGPFDIPRFGGGTSLADLQQRAAENIQQAAHQPHQSQLNGLGALAQNPDISKMVNWSAVMAQQQAYAAQNIYPGAMTGASGGGFITIPAPPSLPPPEIAVQHTDGRHDVTIGGESIGAFSDAAEARDVAERLEGSSYGMADEIRPIVMGMDMGPNDSSAMTIGGTSYIIPPATVASLGSGDITKGQSMLSDFVAGLSGVRKKWGY